MFYRSGDAEAVRVEVGAHFDGVAGFSAADVVDGRGFREIGVLPPRVPYSSHSGGVVLIDQLYNNNKDKHSYFALRGSKKKFKMLSLVDKKPIDVNSKPSYRRSVKLPVDYNYCLINC